MTTLEDKILGEKTHYYCDSSSEDEEEDNNLPNEVPQSTSFRLGSGNGRETCNTGPKGVLNDWNQFKQMQKEKHLQKEAEKLMMINKMSLTCRSNLDDDRDKQLDAELENELASLMDDKFFKEYVKNRMEELLNAAESKSLFGSLISLESGDEFLQAIDDERKDVTVIIHIYDEKIAGCDAMNGCLSCLAQDYHHVKFCKLKASTAGVTKLFKVKGVPALLVYKGGSIVATFVKLGEEFGDDFFACDVEGYLIEHGILHDKTLIPDVIRSASTCTNN